MYNKCLNFHNLTCGLSRRYADVCRYRRSLGEKHDLHLHVPHAETPLPSHLWDIWTPPTRNTPNQSWLVKQRFFLLFISGIWIQQTEPCTVGRMKKKRHRHQWAFTASMTFLIGQCIFQNMFLVFFWTHRPPSHPQKTSIMVGNLYPSQKSWISSSRDIKI